MRFTPTDNPTLGKYHAPVTSGVQKMQYEADIEALRRAMDDDGPKTPKEIAEHKVAMAVRDGWLATAELFQLRCDPVAAQFFSAKVEADLWSMKMRLDTIISEIRAEHGERPLPQLKVVARG